MVVAVERMPSAVELEQAFGGRGVHGVTADAHRRQLEDDQRGRLMREAQVLDNCTAQVWVPATFSGDGAVGPTGFIPFGRLVFIAKPVATSGAAEALLQDGEPDDGPEGEDFDPDTHYRVPCATVVHKWKREKGLYVGAKLLIYALAAVPEGYRTNVGICFTGPAIRIGGTDA